jgi:hypothetical protein
MHHEFMTRIEELSRRPLGVAVGCLTVVAGGFLPWGGVGEVDRSSFEVVRVAGRNDLLSDGVAGPARVWLLAPVAVAAVLVAVAYDRRLVATVVGTAVAVGAVALAVAVWASPMSLRPGVAVSTAGALLVAADAIRQAVSPTPRQEDE